MKNDKDRIADLELKLEQLTALVQVHQKALQIQASINEELISRLISSKKPSVLKSAGLGSKRVSRGPGDREN